MPPSSHRLLALTAWIAVLAVGAFCLWPLAINPGFWGADELVLRHAIGSGQPWFQWSWFTDGSGLFYRPLGFAAACTQLGVCDAEAPQVHWLSIGHHAVNVALCALLFRRLGAPALAAALMALLPTMVEGVAWVAAVYDRLSLSFLLAAALALTLRGPRALWSLPCFALALTTKETAVSFAAVAVLLAWRRDRYVRVAAAAIVLGALGFALTRVGHANTPAPYALRLDANAPVRLLHYFAFPFALDATLPLQVWGSHWWPGLLGIGAVFALALWRSRTAAAAGAVAATAPLLPVALLPQIMGSYAYLATPGLAWVVWSAIGWRTQSTGAPAARGWRAAALAVAAVLVLVPLVVHTRSVATLYYEAGRMTNNLERAYREVPPSSSEVDVACAPGLAKGMATRYAKYLEDTSSMPRLRIVDAAAEDAVLVLTADGEARHR